MDDQLRTDVAMLAEVALIECAMRVTRFWMSVDRRQADECWLWTGSVNKDGYGEFYDGHKMRGAHNVAVEYTTGETRLSGWDTCHSCHNRLCCNPAHLRYAPRQGNVDDMVAAGRQARGERQGNSKLTEADVVTMRQRAANGATGKALAAEYGVSPSLVTGILKGDRWQHAGGPLRTQHGNTHHGRFSHT